MQNHRTALTLLCVFFIAGLMSKNLAAQWAALKKGLKKEVRVAVESDTMLVAHHNTINFSFIATISETPSSDVYRSQGTEGTEVWMTTERFWKRLSQVESGLTAIFEDAFLNDLRHPEAITGRANTRRASSKTDGTGKAAAKQIEKKSPAQSLFSRIDRAADEGDLELASLLLVMLQEQYGDSIAVSDNISRHQLQQSLDKQKAVMEKLYKRAIAHESQEEWDMAAAAYENVLELGAYKDTRTRYDAILPKIRKARDDLRLERKYKAGLAALENRQWQIAILFFERVLSERPDFAGAKQRLEQARFALARSDDLSVNRISNGRTGIANESEVTARTDADRPANPYTIALAAEDSTAAPLPAAEPFRSRNTLFAVAFGLFFALSLFAAIMLFSPIFRAGVYTRLRSYESAAAIYEKMLAKNPGRLKLFRKLGVVYFKAGRKDTQALRIFEMIVKLNLQLKYKDEIKSVVREYRN